MFMESVYKKLDNHERVVTSVIFFLLLTAIAVDLSLDHFADISFKEIIVEMTIVFLVSIGFLFLWIKSERKDHQLKAMKEDSLQLQAELKEWKINAKKFINEFQDFIDSHFDHWGLTEAEKDVALLLLKGLNFSEIAQIRGTRSSTVRGQAHTIYQKSQISGCHELAAYFMEELFS